MVDLTSVIVPILVIGLVAAWYAILRRRPRKPKPTTAGFTRPEDA